MEGTFVTKSGTKAGTQSLPTPMPMSTNPDSHGEINGPPDYKDQVNGILPGYSGHIPRARDKYAGSATGSIAPGKGEDGYKVYGVGGHVAIGPQAGHVRPEDVLPPRFVEYIEKSAGCMPGYTGFRPESVHVKNVAAYGGIPHQVTGNAGEVGLNFSMQSDNSTAMHLEQGDRSYDWRRTPLDAPPPSFRDNVGGVLPGYAGHVPRAVEKHGTSHYGGLAPDKEYVPLAQTGHEGYKIDPASGAPGEKEVDLKMIPNYRECWPRARSRMPVVHIVHIWCTPRSHYAATAHLRCAPPPPHAPWLPLGLPLALR